ncbi:MAG TPA: S41 family peptidase [Sphingomonas sp.]|jgi:hypothetical protein
MHRRSFMMGLGAAATLPTLGHAADPMPGDLAGDIAVLREALKLHPGLYRYNSPAAIEARIAALAPAFVGAPTRTDRYLLLSRFLATIRCGHSYCNFFNQRKPVAAELFDRPTRLPFRFRWVDKRMVVVGDPAGLGLAAGTEITAVNGVAPAAMLARLMPYARADGGNDAKRVSLLDMRGDDRIEYFDVFHGLLYGAPAGGEHQLELMAPDGRATRRSVPAIGLEARRAQMTQVPDDDPARPLWTWTLRPDGVAVLTMPGWALYNSKWDWRGWLDTRLDSLRGAKGLVVDLRDNEGGIDCGNALLARLSDRPVMIPPGERRITYRRTPADLDRHLDTWDDSFRTLGVGAAPRGDGTFLLPPDDETLAIQPRPTRVTVPVAALVGPVNSSATHQFAEVARATGLVRLFGEPTGGNRRGINGGRFFFVRLPASGIEFDLPLIGYFPPGSPPDAGVLPDVAVGPTRADIAAGRDPAMEAAARWARRTA